MGFSKFTNLLKRFLPDAVVKFLMYIKHYKNLTIVKDGQPSLIGMISGSEQAFYTECTKALAQSNGAIVDLGCWMGATSISLARGISDKNLSGSDLNQKVYAFDRFIWEPWMDPFLPNLYCRYEQGESFLPEVRRNILQYENTIQLIQADLKEYKWEKGSIKILLVDAMKNRQLTQAIATSFFPFLDLRSILIHQDFKHYYSPFIHILQYRLRDYFCFKDDVLGGATVAFETVQKVPMDVVALAANFDKVADAELEDAMNYAIELVNVNQRSTIAAAHLMYYVHTNNAEEGRIVLEKYSSQNLVPTDDLQLATDALTNMMG